MNPDYQNQPHARGKTSVFGQSNIAAIQCYKKQSRPARSGFFMPELLARVAGVFLKVRHNCAIFKFRH
jgi:hypothetical protein